MIGSAKYQWNAPRGALIKPSRKVSSLPPERRCPMVSDSVFHFLEGSVRLTCGRRASRESRRELREGTF